MVNCEQKNIEKLKLIHLNIFLVISHSIIKLFEETRTKYKMYFQVTLK